ncbi:MAG: nitroreductase family protein [Atribacterota bacterium]|nr:nitroreductase family protein [Atribacterota bacterium]
MFSLIKKRRSIRVFQKRKVEKEKINQIMQAALMSPSSKNNNPWKFMIIDDQIALQKISQAKKAGSQFLANSPLAIVVLADPERSDVWIEDCSIASTFIILAAQNLELGSCWVQIRKREHADGSNAEEYIKELLDIPNHLQVPCVIAIGYPAEEKADKQVAQEKIKDVYYNKYGRTFF